MSRCMGLLLPSSLALNKVLKKAELGKFRM
jgi:hypothetical protein